MYKNFDATLHLSYVPISGQADLDSLAEDAYKMVFKPHIQRAEEIIEREISDTAKNLRGMIYDLEGKTATPFNFYITDGEQHFFRGSFYFNEKTVRDSVLPIYNFINEDIMYTLQSFEFR
jgi:gliding motility-associated lipoprotein GldD